VTSSYGMLSWHGEDSGGGEYRLCAVSSGSVLARCGSPGVGRGLWPAWLVAVWKGTRFFRCSATATAAPAVVNVPAQDQVGFASFTSSRPQRVHRGEPGPLRPGLQPGGQPEQCLARLDELVRVRAAGPWRDRAGDHGDHSLDQARGACRAPGVADAGRYRAKSRGDGPVATQLREGRQFRQIPGGCASAVSFHEMDVSRINRGLAVRGKQVRSRHLGGKRCCCPAGDFRVHGQCRGASVRCPHEYDDAASVAWEEPSRIGVVHAHLVGAKFPRRCPPGQPVFRDPQFGTAGHREIQITGTERIASHGDGMQRVRVCGLRESVRRCDPKPLTHRLAHIRCRAGDDQRRVDAAPRPLQARSGIPKAGTPYACALSARTLQACTPQA
jgi:hypothetical protein